MKTRLLPLALLPILAAALPGQALDPPPAPQRFPIAGAVRPGDLRSLSVAELVARMPPDPWKGGEAPEILHPVAAELRDRASGGRMSGDEWRVALSAADVIHTRTRWPAGQPLMLWIRRPAWLPRLEITVAAIEPPLGEIRAECPPAVLMCGHAAQAIADRERALALGKFPAHTTGVVLQVTVEQYPDSEPVAGVRREPSVLWSGRIDKRIQAVSTLEQVLAPTSRELEDKAIRESVRAWRRASEAYEDVELRIAAGGGFARREVLRGIGISLSIELWLDGVRKGDARLVADRGVGPGERSSGLEGVSCISGLPGHLDDPNADLSGWTLRVRGTSEQLLGLWEVDRFWSGAFEMPLAEALARAAAK